MWRGPLQIAALVAVGAACLGWQSPASQRNDEVAYLKKRTLDAVKKCERLAESEKALKLRVESLENSLRTVTLERDQVLAQQSDEQSHGAAMLRGVLKKMERRYQWGGIVASREETDNGAVVVLQGTLDNLNATVQCALRAGERINRVKVGGVAMIDGAVAGIEIQRVGWLRRVHVTSHDGVIVSAGALTSDGGG